MEIVAIFLFQRKLRSIWYDNEKYVHTAYFRNEKFKCDIKIKSFKFFKNLPKNVAEKK